MKSHEKQWNHGKTMKCDGNRYEWTNINERRWKSMNMNGSLWKTLKLNENVWTFMQSHDNLWKAMNFMEIDEHLCKSVETNDN